MIKPISGLHEAGDRGREWLALHRHSPGKWTEGKKDVCKKWLFSAFYEPYEAPWKAETKLDCCIQTRGVETSLASLDRVAKVFFAILRPLLSCYLFLRQT